jgi:SAM-dependent methyltransferase
MSEPNFLTTTRTGYDDVADLYSEMFRDVLDETPYDRAMIDVFAELVKESEPPKAADLGCGPGHVTGYVHGLGVDIVGIDLSSDMLAIARREHPEIVFAEGTMTALELPDAALGGILSRWSIIHTPPERLPEVFAECHRVLAPGGHLLLGFFAHDDDSQLGWPFEHRVALAWRLSIDPLADLLREAGFQEKARLIERSPEQSRRGYDSGHLMLRKPE